VAYFLEYDETAVTPYLLALDLSPEGREALIRVLDQFAENGDFFVRNPDLRLAPGSEYFRVEWVFQDPATKIFHALRLIISDAAAQYGVLRVVYAEDFAANFPWPGKASQP
jgi:hypothetical protein